jgi:hypothetical protein
VSVCCGTAEVRLFDEGFPTTVIFFICCMGTAELSGAEPYAGIDIIVTVIIATKTSRRFVVINILLPER